MANLFVMVGLPGSGKSTYAEQLIIENDADVIVSSDKIREELFNDVNNQDNNNLVFTTVHERIIKYLEMDKNVVFDATNLSRKRRIAFLDQIDNNHGKYAIIMATPYEICLEQNNIREKQVPESVIKRMLTNFEVPCYEEGFDGIIIKYNTGEMEFDLWDKLEELREFDQCNHHHRLSLGEHMLDAGMYITRYWIKNYYNKELDLFSFSNYSNVLLAAYCHDLGKEFTKSNVNKKGEITEDYHYYEHHNVGGYLALFYLKEYLDIDRLIYVCNLITMHMRPFLAYENSQKAFEKDKKRYGLAFMEDLIILHEADLAAH